MSETVGLYINFFIYLIYFKMKANYFSRRMSMLLIALTGVATMFAEEPKIVNFTELQSPVIGTEGPEKMPYISEASAAWGDYNNDGYLDLLVGGMYKINEYQEDEQEIKLTVFYKNNGDGTFDKVEQHPFPNFRQGGIAWLDYNNDGYLDVFIAGDTDEGEYSGFFENLGPEQDYAFTEIFSAEFDYFRTNGNKGPSRLIAVGDYDNDGWVDIAVTGWSTGSGGRIVHLYKNLQGSAFRLLETPVDGEKQFIRMNGGTLYWGDYNRDGYLDLLAFGYIQADDEFRENYDETLFYDLRPDCDNGTCISGAGILYVNNGDGTFKTPTATEIYPFGDDGEAAWGDYNNDGYLDFYATGYAWWKEADLSTDVGWNIGLYENDGNGTLVRHDPNTVGLLGTQADTKAWGDVNNDGWEDIVVTRSHPTAVFFNTGEGNFSKFNMLFHYDDELKDADHEGGTICLVDIDNDGDLDVFLNGEGSGKLSQRLLRNDLDAAEGILPNQAPTAPANLQATIDDDGVTTFTWDASTDDLTPSAALRYNLYVKQDDVIKSVLPADLTTGRLKVNEQLAPIMGTSYKISGLEGEYEWGVQAIDNGKMASLFTVYGETSINTVKLTSVSVVGEKQVIRIQADNALAGTVTVYTAAGSSVFTKAGQINNTSIELPAGLYVVKTTSAEGSVVKKVVVK
jgi:hypothetical protein